MILRLATFLRYNIFGSCKKSHVENANMHEYTNCIKDKYATMELLYIYIDNIILLWNYYIYIDNNIYMSESIINV